MGKINNVLQWAKNEVDIRSPSQWEIDLTEWLGLDAKGGKLSETTYFVCLKVLSETIGKLPLKMYQQTNKGRVRATSQAYEVLSRRPNKYMTPSTFWATIEMCRNHYGNAYVYPAYNHKGELDSCHILQSDNMQIIIDDAAKLSNDRDRVWYEYSGNGTRFVFREDEIWHFKTSTSFDGISGRSVGDILRDSIAGSLDSQDYMNQLYKNGMTGKATLEYTGDLNDAKVMALLQSIKKYASGSTNAGGIIPVPPGMKLVPVAMKLADSQFFELKKYGALQIASAFGIKPNHLNNYEKSSYANSESQNMSFYVDTLQFILAHYEEEINYKLLTRAEVKDGYFFKFNEKVLLRTDSDKQMEILAKAVNNAIYTPNEARMWLDMPSDKHGDKLVMNGNYIPLEQVGQQYGIKEVSE